MREKTQQEDLIVRYLLGDLTEKEQIQIEEQFFADDEYFEQICAVEDALIDDYVQKNLAESDRVKVERLLQSSSRQAREVNFSRDVIRYISETSPKDSNEQNSIRIEHPGKWRSLFKWLHIKNSGRRFSFAVMLLLTVMGIYMTMWNLALQKRSKQLQARQEVMEERYKELAQQIAQQAEGHDSIIKELESERKKRAQLETDLIALQDSKPPTSANEIAFLELKTGSFTRGEGKLKVVQIRPGVSLVQIGITLDENEYKAYSAEIKTFEGARIWDKDQIRPRVGGGNSPRIVLTLPVSILDNQDYIITLKGQTEAGSIVEIRDYSFGIRR